MLSAREINLTTGSPNSITHLMYSSPTNWLNRSSFSKVKMHICVSFDSACARVCFSHSCCCVVLESEKTSPRSDLENTTRLHPSRMGYKGLCVAHVSVSRVSSAHVSWVIAGRERAVIMRDGFARGFIRKLDSQDRAIRARRSDRVTWSSCSNFKRLATSIRAHLHRALAHFLQLHSRHRARLSFMKIANESSRLRRHLLRSWEILRAKFRLRLSL